jgi:hypothetical protein
MDLIVLIFAPGFMLFVWLVPVGANGGFSAKRQEFQVERSAIDTSPDRVHCSFVCAEDAADGEPSGCVPAKSADEDYHWFFLGCIFCGLLLVPQRKAGRGRVKEDKPLPLAVGEGPYFESARGLLGGT